ncbi:MAG: class I SAM-dependent methyltransferase [Bdellovibrionales bacterium]|nr:class I SAM-dependent methyltransferase [Bdellovibrionales bacterium]
MGDESDSATSWALRLFSKSVLKQRKWKELTRALGDCSGKRCLDLGSDNGVISYLLRRRGGSWASADLSEETVDSIRSLVKNDVHLIKNQVLPFADGEFDAVAVVDMLEHVPDDSAFMLELSRVLKPGGLLLLNVPNLKPLSPLRLLRQMIGQTDEAHGHLRPGYNDESLKQLFGSELQLERSHTYSRFFSELIDTAIVFAYGLLSGGHKAENSEEVSKGLVVTEAGLKKFEKKFKLYSMIYPLVLAVSKLDLLIPFLPGFMRMAVVRKGH